MTPDDVEVLDGRGAHLRRYVEDGWQVFGVTWLPEIAEGTMSHADAAALFARLRELLGIAIEIEVLPARRRTARVLVPQAAAGSWGRAP